MRYLRILPFLIVLSAAALFEPVIEAASGRPRGFRTGFEISTYLTFNQFASETLIDDDIGFGVRWGYFFTPNHEFELLYNGVSAEGLVFDTFLGVFVPSRIDVNNFQAAYVYNFRPRGVIPYVTLGLGFLDFDDRLLGRESDLVLGGGAGMRVFFGRVAYARFEFRHNRFEGDGRVFVTGENFWYNELAFGVGWRFPTR